MPRETKKILWFVAEEKGGIRSYSDTLWPAIQSQMGSEIFEEVELTRPIFQPGLAKSAVPQSVHEIVSKKPTIVHVQHEFGLFGSKIPGHYSFPLWLKRLRAAMPGVKVVATAHNVLQEGYRYPIQGRGWQVPLRFLANTFLSGYLRKNWTAETWGNLDGVLVHSATQKNTILNSGCLKVQVVPHFVPKINVVESASSQERPCIVVFGYFSPEKGQDIAIEAFSDVNMDAQLILAGSIRRKADRPYYTRCMELIEQSEKKDRITVLDFVPEQELDTLFSKASLVLAPFRDTHGSGSIVQAMARGIPVLASDLTLNREFNEREPGSLALFETGDSISCAREIERLLNHPTEREKLVDRELSYARTFSIEKMAKRHLEFYLSLIESN